MRFGFWEILLIVALIFLLFGANKFPEMMKRLAEGMKVFKTEMDDKPKKTEKAEKKPTAKKKK